MLGLGLVLVSVRIRVKARVRVRVRSYRGRVVCRRDMIVIKCHHVGKILQGVRSGSFPSRPLIEAALVLVFVLGSGLAPSRPLAARL